MPLPLLLFAVKGIIVLGKAAVATKKVATISKLTTMAVHHYGAASVFSTVTFASITVGGIYWTKERFEDVGEMYSAWENNDNNALFQKFGSFLSKINTLSSTTVCDSIHDIMNHHGLNKMIDVNGFIKKLYEIVDEARRSYRTA